MVGDWKSDLLNRLDAPICELVDITLIMTTDEEIHTERDRIKEKIKKLQAERLDLMGDIERLPSSEGAKKSLLQLKGKLFGFNYDCFAFPYGYRYSKTLFVVDRDGNFQSRELVDDRLDFHKHRVIQVEKDLLAFKSGRPVRVIKYSNPRDSNSLRRSRLPSLEQRLKYFAIANHRN